VCLSFLNTWAGEPWTSVQTISSILLTISSILNNTPLLNEPFIKKGDERIQMYNKIIEFNNIKIAYLGIFNKKYLPTAFEIFYSDIEKIFYKNLENVISFCQGNVTNEKEITTICVSIYSMKCIINYNTLIEELKLIKTNKIDIKINNLIMI
jgi:hypothetical protein